MRHDLAMFYRQEVQVKQHMNHNRTTTDGTLKVLHLEKASLVQIKGMRAGDSIKSSVAPPEKR